MKVKLLLKALNDIIIYVYKRKQLEYSTVTILYCCINVYAQL